MSQEGKNSPHERWLLLSSDPYSCRKHFALEANSLEPSQQRQKNWLLAPGLKSFLSYLQLSFLTLLWLTYIYFSKNFPPPWRQASEVPSSLESSTFWKHGPFGLAWVPHHHIKLQRDYCGWVQETPSKLLFCFLFLLVFHTHTNTKWKGLCTAGAKGGCGFKLLISLWFLYHLRKSGCECSLLQPLLADTLVLNLKPEQVKGVTLLWLHYQKKAIYSKS